MAQSNKKKEANDLMAHPSWKYLCISFVCPEIHSSQLFACIERHHAAARDGDQPTLPNVTQAYQTVAHTTQAIPCR
jgi:hypothetical protein